MAITTDPDETDPDYWVIKYGLIVLPHHGGEKGRHYPGTPLITIRSDLGHVQHRCTLMHEIAHLIHGDTPTTHPWLHARQERRAHEWAAQRLISKEAYEQAEQLAGHHDSAIAAELQVTKKYVHIWRSIHSRAHS